jgi:hypothetical protein
MSMPKFKVLSVCDLFLAETDASEYPFSEIKFLETSFMEAICFDRKENFCINLGLTPLISVMAEKRAADN